MKKVRLLLAISLFVMVSGICRTQIPNSGFENWSDSGNHLDPEGWWTTNYVVTSGTYFPVTRSIDHFPPDVGEYSLRMENNPGLLPDWSALGIAWTGDFEGNEKPVFPITGHPTSIWGYFKFFPENNDTFEIHIRLHKDGEDIGGGSFKTGNRVAEWTPFEIRIADYMEADSARILFSSCYDNDEPAPKGNSVLLIDNLSFDQLITGSFDRKQTQKRVSLYPNPARETLTVILAPLSGQMIELGIYDSYGQQHMTRKTANSSESIVFDVSGLQPGVYFVQSRLDGRIIDVSRVVISQ